jgi:hypothetical protein
MSTKTEQSPAEIRADLAALQKRLATTKRELEAVDAAVGKDYQSLLEGRSVAEDTERRTRVLQLDQRALEAGIKAAEQALADAEERERVNAARALYDRLAETVVEDVLPAGQAIEEAMDALAVAFVRLNGSANRSLGIVGQLPDAVLGPDGWTVMGSARGVLEPGSLQHLIELGMYKRLPQQWSYDRVGGRIPTVSGEAAGSALRLLNQFAAIHRLPVDQIGQPAPLVAQLDPLPVFDLPAVATQDDDGLYGEEATAAIAETRARPYGSDEDGE